MSDDENESSRYIRCVRTQFRILEIYNHKAFRRGYYNPETAVIFIRGEYLGKRGVIENVTRKNYLKIRIDFYDEKKNISISDRPSNFSGICI